MKPEIQAPLVQVISEVTIGICNVTDRYIHLNKGHIVSRAEEVDEVIPQTESYNSSREKKAPRRLLESPKTQFCERGVGVDEVTEHVRKLWEKSSVHLTPEQLGKVGKLLTEYSDVFPRNELQFGNLSGIKHQVSTGTATPINKKCVGPHYVLKMREKSSGFIIKMGVIELSTSGWASPPVLVRKKDGKV